MGIVSAFPIVIHKIRDKAWNWTLIFSAICWWSSHNIILTIFKEDMFLQREFEKQAF